MDIRTVAFSVQLGTEGLAIAQTVAGRLGYHYVDWNDTSRAAAESGVEVATVNEFQHNRPRFLRLVDRLLTSVSMINDEYTSDAAVDPAVMSWAMGSMNDSGYRGFVENVVRELAVKGQSVIVGHAAQVVLREEPTAYRVLICGEEETRAKRLAAETAAPLEECLKDVRQSDDERLSLYKRVYDVDPFAPASYDLTLNCDRMPREVAVECVLAAVRRSAELTAPA